MISPPSAALKTHPDRIPADHPDRASRTRKFQLVNDAYYTLSDATRRRDYDAQRKLFSGFGGFGTGTGTGAGAGTGTRPSAAAGGGGPGAQMPGGFGAFPFDPFADADEAEAEAAADAGANGPGLGNAFSWAWNFFTGGGTNPQHQQQERERAENEQFADVFEEMLREEGMAADEGQGTRPTGKFWSVLGGVSGGALGFIVANVPGLVAGAVAGNRLGAVRDAKGKSVYAVFQVSGHGCGKVYLGRGRVVLTRGLGAAAGGSGEVA